MPLAHEIHAFLHSHGIHLQKKLGQHFLVDQRVLHDIVRAAGVTQQDHVIEIGAGIGILTRELCKHAGRITAIECDRRLIPILQEFLQTGNQQLATSNLHVVCANALTFPYPETPYKIVANIPYYLTGRLLRTLLRKATRPPTSLTLLVQKEVAEKMMGKPERTLLTLLVECAGKATIVREVPSTAFLPPPKVESAIIHIACFQEPPADSKTLDILFELATVAFRKKRKMLRASLGKSARIAETLATSGIDPTRRPETLSVQEWLLLANAQRSCLAGRQANE